MHFRVGGGMGEGGGVIMLMGVGEMGLASPANPSWVGPLVIREQIDPNRAGTSQTKSNLQHYCVQHLPLQFMRVCT